MAMREREKGGKVGEGASERHCILRGQKNISHLKMTKQWLLVLLVELSTLFASCCVS
jgi:hypothetical protein